MQATEGFKLHDCFKLISEDEHLQERCDHEAGHFVMLHALGVYHVPKFMSVEPHTSSQAGGICFVGLEEELKLEDAVFHELGGMVAQIVGISSRFKVSMGDPSMREHVRRAEIGGGADILQLQAKYGVDDDYVYGSLSMIRERVEENWRYIAALSEQLKERRFLYHEEPRMIVNATKSGDPDHYRMIRMYRDWRRPANPDDHDCSDFLKYYAGRPFFEPAAQTLARFTNR